MFFMYSENIQLSPFCDIPLFDWMSLCHGGLVWNPWPIMFLRALSAEVEVRRVRDGTVQVQGPQVKLGMGKGGICSWWLRCWI